MFDKEAYRKGLVGKAEEKMEPLLIQIERLCADISVDICFEINGIDGIIGNIPEIEALYKDLKIKIEAYQKLKDFIGKNKANDE